MRTPSRSLRATRRKGPAGPFAPGPDATVPRTPLPALLIAAAALVVVTLAAYWAAPGHDFVDMDDVQYVRDNFAVLGRQYDVLLRSVVASNFHPLTMISLAWNVTTPLSARPFIVTNIALHVMNTLLVFWLVWWLSNRRLLVAVFVALLFGIHPMHVESVAWVSERKDVLYTFFFLGGLIAYWHYLMHRRWPALALAFILFVSSCLSKGMAVVFPVVMLLLDLWQRRPLMERRAVIEKLPFFAVSLLFGVIALDVQKGGDFHGTLLPVGLHVDALTIAHTLTPLQRLVLPAHGYMTYIARVFVPLDLSAFEPYPSARELGQLRYLAAPLGVIAALALMLWDLRRTRVLTFGLGWFLVTLLLVLQWIPVGGAIVADRYSYLSYLGPFFIMGMAVQGAFDRWPLLGATLWGAGGLFAIFLFFQTTRQVATWRDADTLWERILHVHPDVAWVHSVRGAKRSANGQTQLALDDFLAALRLGLRNADVYDGLGVVYGRLGKLDSSLIMLDRAAALEPSRAGIYFNRGATYQAMGRQREALADMDRVIALMPDQAAKIHGPRAYAMMQIGQYREAAAEFDRAVALDSTNVELLYNRGCCRLELGDQAGAARDFRAMLRLDSTETRARDRLQRMRPGALKKHAQAPLRGTDGMLKYRARQSSQPGGVP